jgi:hypothetical protein
VGRPTLRDAGLRILISCQRPLFSSLAELDSASAINTNDLHHRGSPSCWVSSARADTWLSPKKWCGGPRGVEALHLVLRFCTIFAPFCQPLSPQKEPIQKLNKKSPQNRSSGVVLGFEESAGNAHELPPFLPVGCGQCEEFIPRYLDPVNPPTRNGARVDQFIFDSAIFNSWKIIFDVTSQLLLPVRHCER